MSHPVALLLAHANGHAASLSVSSGALVADDPFAAGRGTAFIDDHGFAAGVVTLSGRRDVASHPVTEMLVLHRGALTFTSNDQTLQLAPGDSLVIGRGTAFSVNASADSLWAWCGTTQPGDAPWQPGLTALDRYAHLTPSAAPDAQILVGPAPQCRAQGLFEEGTLRIGVWDSTPYERGSRGHLCHELMHVIEGQVTLRLSDSEDLVVNAGDTVFVPKGTGCAWVSGVYVRKFYAVV